MKPQLGNLLVPELRPARASVPVAPSLRIPATAKNRSLLRWMRAVELSAWQAKETWHPTSERLVATGSRVKPCFQLNCR